MKEMIKGQIKVLIVDDHWLFAEGLRLIMSQMSEEDEFDIVTISSNGKDALENLKKYSFDLMILDLNMPIMDGIELLTHIKKASLFTSVKKLVVTGYQDDKFTRSALKNGADGIILKSSKVAKLFEAIKSVLDGKLYIGEGLRTSPVKGMVAPSHLPNSYDLKDLLTKRELEVLVLVSKGNSNKIVASDLFISPETVSVHRKNIIKKLKLKNTAELIKFAIDYNLI